MITTTTMTLGGTRLSAIPPCYEQAMSALHARKPWPGVVAGSVVASSVVDGSGVRFTDNSTRVSADRSRRE